MGNKKEITVGDRVMVKVGRNMIQAEILRPMADGDAFLVKSLTSCKEFIMSSARITPSSVNNIEEAPAAMPNVATAAPKKKMTLFQAAIKVLQETGRSLNTQEIVKLAISMGYWTPSAGKTPSLTLYSCFLREMKTKASPAITRANVKGQFRLA